MAISQRVSTPVKTSKGLGMARLTPREWEIVDLISLGLTNKEIAARLLLSDNTVKAHIHMILTKLELANRTQVAVAVACAQVRLPIMGDAYPPDPPYDE